MILDELGLFLQGAGHGTLATDLFQSEMLETPDDAVAIFETGSGPSMYTHSQPGASVEKPHIQVLVRSKSYPVARQKAEDIYRTLDTLRNAVLSGVRYLSIRPLQLPFMMKKDGNRRVTVAFNVEVMKEPS